MKAKNFLFYRLTPFPAKTDTECLRYAKDGLQNLLESSAQKAVNDSVKKYDHRHKSNIPALHEFVPSKK